MDYIHSSRNPKTRYVTLHSSAIFASLVSLFTPLFVMHWKHFKTHADIFPPPEGVSKRTYAARVYISHWFLDLYASNRNAIMNIHSLAFSEHFEHDAVHFSHSYDKYLTLLNAAIRPTHVKGALDDAIYIPLISSTINWACDGNNPFNITNFSANYDYFMAIIWNMKYWKMSNLVTNNFGRPSWLFDWHGEACCTWFPPVGNYTNEDVTIAYIIGEACTPNLGPRDVDDWTTFEEGMSHTNFVANALPRSINRRFYGCYEIRTVEVRASDYLDATYLNTKTSDDQSSASRTIEPSLALSTVDQGKVKIKSGHQYQITDWTYYARVQFNFEIDTREMRSSALMTIVMD